MKPILKYVVACAFLAMTSTVFTGCMLMMPAMMAPGMLKASNSSDQEREQMIKDAISELAINGGGYNTIELGRIETDKHAISEKKFREIIVNQIAASGQLVLTEPGQNQTAAVGITGEDQHVRAILDAELLRLESRDRLELKMKDSRSGLIVWEKRFYSSPPSSTSSHSH
jgi:hypothetical protein